MNEALNNGKWLVKNDPGYENPKKFIGTAAVTWAIAAFTFLLVNPFGGVVFALIGFAYYRHAFKVEERNDARIFFFNCEHQDVRRALAHWKRNHHGQDLTVEQLSGWISKGWGKWENPDDFFALCSIPGKEVRMFREGDYHYLRPVRRKEE